jgi:hypothetical protein
MIVLYKQRDNLLQFRHVRMLWLDVAGLKRKKVLVELLKT